ncbi:hypothetical protein SAMN05421788_102113 [Filimonas lacunae]|uniref:Uncharacterized protein n=1 Tax=Filimonas lacunae TaxID=477680 RepID=A0A173MI15_9BACT|nr:hypothetical protein [Filimonas lacunae]BAV07263.1 hypothetical protein FLA_3286 [Filimonas lacunae]SIS92333.1 hypothetical protein SAMN05421788_102113 [Filimonas lacunae]
MSYHNSTAMTTADILLLSKKIALGIAIFLLPLAVIAGGLWLTWYLFH